MMLPVQVCYPTICHSDLLCTGDSETGRSDCSEEQSSSDSSDEVSTQFFKMYKYNKIWQP